VRLCVGADARVAVSTAGRRIFLKRVAIPRCLLGSMNYLKLNGGRMSLYPEPKSVNRKLNMPQVQPGKTS